MKKINIIFLCLFFIYQSTAQQNLCLTNSSTSNHCNNPNITAVGPFYLRIFVHVIRDSDGTGGQTREQVKEALRLLDEMYNPQDIFFVWDCNIDYIDDHSFFVTQNGTPLIFHENSHKGGIDIYLFPESPEVPAPTGAGMAAAVGSSAFYVAGNFPQFPHTNFTTSHGGVSHEMGHCLGLFHTFHDANNQFVNDQNCQNGQLFMNHGDCVCDTPADPGMNYNVTPDPNPELCFWNSSGTDPNNDIYDPEESNVMSYTHQECYATITPGQRQRMLNIIKTNISLINSTVNFDFINHSFPLTTSIPSGNYYARGNITIEPGATLTIPSDVTITFAENSKLIVKQNATLNLEGTLTGFCNKTWRGIEVWSDGTKTQYYDLSLLKFHQGRFLGKEGAKIENADVALQLFGPTSSNGGGGIARAEGVTFKNNRVGIQTMFYQNGNIHPLTGASMPYAGNFIECNFETDSNYPTDNRFTSIRLVGVKGVNIIGCSFINSYIPKIDCDEFVRAEYGTGIRASDAGFTVKGRCLSNSPFDPCYDYIRSRFIGLGYGVSATRMQGSNMPFTVQQADFEDCYIGISVEEVHEATIIHNTFSLGNLLDPDCVNEDSPCGTEVGELGQIGVYMEGPINGMFFEENIFQDPTGSDIKTIGTSVFRLLNFNNVIRRNSFDGLDYANLAFGVNADFSQGGGGLSYQCNNITNTIEYDFLVRDLPDCDLDNSVVRKKQGLLNGNVFDAAGNTFSHSGAPSDSDFRYDNSIFQPDIEYFFYDPQIPNSVNSEEPLDVLNVEKISLNIFPNACPINFCPPPCQFTIFDMFNLQGSKQEFYTYRDEYHSAKTDYEAATSSNNDALAEQHLYNMNVARIKMDRNAQLILHRLMTDTINYNQDSIRNWWNNIETYSSDLTLAADYTTTDQWIEASTILYNAPTKYNLSIEEQDDLNDRINIYSLINQKTLYGLDDNDFNLIKIIADKFPSLSSSLARNILEFHEIKYYPPVYFIPQSEPNNERQEGTDKKKRIQYNLNVHPNPANDYILFTWDELPETPHIKLFDMVGRVVWEGTLVKNNNIFRLNTDFLESGLYIFQLYNNNKITNAPTGKLIIQKP